MNRATSRFVIAGCLLLFASLLVVTSSGQEMEPAGRVDLLRTKDGSYQLGRLISFDGKVYVWRDDKGGERRIPADEIAGVVLTQPATTAGTSTLLITPQGEPVAVTREMAWADRLVSFTVGDPKPAEVLGGRDALGKPNYIKGNPRTYVSLGHGGELVVEFTATRLVDVAGPDLLIVEIGPAVEPTLVSISKDGMNWVSVGKVRGAISTIEIEPHIEEKGRQYRFVKITDAKAGLSNDSKWPGADIDAVGAIGAAPASK